MEKRWITHLPDAKTAADLSEQLNINPVTAQALINRGLKSPEAARDFLSPSLERLDRPLLLKDMDRAVARIIKAIDDSEKITIYGDYDVDGTTSTALLLKFFKEINASCNYYIPDRMSEGYGLNNEAIKGLYEDGTRLIITVDNGISSCDEISYASTLGVDVIVTDHHQVPDEVPEAYAIINPNQITCPYPCKELAGVGIAFNLAVALRTGLREKGFWKDSIEPNLKRYLGLVALGTIADIAPLTGTNRTMAVFGLKELTAGNSAGINALKKVSAIQNDVVNVGSVGFQLAPRLNAAGRLSKADTGVKLLMTDDEKEAAKLAEELNEENKKRRSLEKEILLEALEMVEEGGLDERKSIVLSSANWHEGVIGIVASRLVEKYYRPTLLISIKEGKGKGSARSIEGFHLYNGLEECSEYLLSYGGHKYAAGFTIEEKSIGDFSAAINQSVDKMLEAEDFIPPVKIDENLELDEIDEGLIDELQMLSPFGAGNREPLFMTEGVKVLSSTVLKDAHLKMSLGKGRAVFDAIGFNMAEKKVCIGEIISIAYSPQFNEWKGRKSIQLKIKDLKV